MLLFVIPYVIVLSLASIAVLLAVLEPGSSPYEPSTLDLTSDIDPIREDL